MSISKREEGYLGLGISVMVVMLSINKNAINKWEFCRLTFGEYVGSSGFEFNISFFGTSDQRCSICFDTAVVWVFGIYMTGSLQ